MLIYIDLDLQLVVRWEGGREERREVGMEEGREKEWEGWSGKWFDYYNTSSIYHHA